MVSSAYTLPANQKLLNNRLPDTTEEAEQLTTGPTSSLLRWRSVAKTFPQWELGIPLFLKFYILFIPFPPFLLLNLFFPADEWDQENAKKAGENHQGFVTIT